jgi:hypothetical protein
MLIFLYYDWQYMARRHCLPLVTFTIFYVPAGLEVLAQWLEARLSKGRSQTSRNPQLWFAVLFVTGAGLCMPKLLRPSRADKPGYWDAIKWLKKNTDAGDVIAVTDKRISFYAEREGEVYIREFPERAKYLVRVVGGEDEDLDIGRLVERVFSVWEDERTKAKRIVIWKVLQPTTATIYRQRRHVAERHIEWRIQREVGLVRSFIGLVSKGSFGWF